MGVWQAGCSGHVDVLDCIGGGSVAGLDNSIVPCLATGYRARRQRCRISAAAARLRLIIQHPADRQTWLAHTGSKAGASSAFQQRHLICTSTLGALACFGSSCLPMFHCRRCGGSTMWRQPTRRPTEGHSQTSSMQQTRRRPGPLGSAWWPLGIPRCVPAVPPSKRGLPWFPCVSKLQTDTCMLLLGMSKAVPRPVNRAVLKRWPVPQLSSLVFFPSWTSINIPYYMI